VITLMMKDMTRIREVVAYAQDHRITIEQAIIRLVNSGLSHEGDA
jgi:hypothetical protein